MSLAAKGSDNVSDDGDGYGNVLMPTSGPRCVLNSCAPQDIQ